MFLAIQILQVLLLSPLTGSESYPPSSQPTDYFAVHTTTARLKIPDRSVKGGWDVEYNYGRKYKHSQGEEWGNGHNVRDISKTNKYEENVTPIWSSGNARKTFNVITDKYLPFNNFKKQFEKEIGSRGINWYNWPSKNLTWPNWTAKTNPYQKQLIPWWNSDTHYQQIQNAATFMLPMQEQFFRPRSIGWTGDLGPFDEVPTPSWYCC